MKKSIADIMAIRESMQSQIILRDNVDAEKEIHLIVGMGTSGINAGAREVFNALVDYVEEHELKGFRVTRTGSLAGEGHEPVLEVRVPGKDPVVYTDTTVAKAVEIIKNLAK